MSTQSGEWLYSKRPYSSAIAANNVEELQRLFDSNYPRRDPILEFYDAVKLNHVECLAWLLDHYPCTEDSNNIPYSVYERMVIDTCTYGSLECLRLLLSRKVDRVNKAYMEAVRNKNDACLQLLVEMGVPKCAEAYIHAAENGDFECMEYLHRNDFPKVVCGASWSQDVYDCVLFTKQYEAISWLRDRGFPINKDAESHYMDVIRTHENMELLELLDFLCRSGCKKSQSACTMAVRKRRIDILEWLIKRKFPKSSDACLTAAELGYSDILLWLIKHKFPKSNNACSWAKFKGRTECLQLLIEHKFPHYEEYVTADVVKGE